MIFQVTQLTAPGDWLGEVSKLGEESKMALGLEDGECWQEEHGNVCVCVDGIAKGLPLP